MDSKDSDTSRQDNTNCGRCWKTTGSAARGQIQAPARRLGRGILYFAVGIPSPRRPRQFMTLSARRGGQARHPLERSEHCGWLSSLSALAAPRSRVYIPCKDQHGVNGLSGPVAKSRKINLEAWYIFRCGGYIGPSPTRMSENGCVAARSKLTAALPSRDLAGGSPQPVGAASNSGMRITTPALVR